MKTNGFTLIEVLIALSVIAIGLMGVLNANLQATANASKLQNKLFALWVLENSIAEIRVRSTEFPISNHHDKQQQARQFWQTQTITTDNENPLIQQTRLIISTPVGVTETEVLLQQDLYLRRQLEP